MIAPDPPAAGNPDPAMERRSKPVGVVALTGFFAFGVAMSSLACAALLFPQSVLSRVWNLNPEAKSAFAAIGPWAIVLMATAATGCALAAVGLWRGARWGRIAAMAMLTVNLAGDLTNAVFRGDLRTLIGLPIGGALIAYLQSARVRRYFAGG